MSSGLRKHLKQLPYFLLYNYPKKLKTYNKIKEKNKTIENKEDKLKLNAYHSPSPMNELCDYICTWEKKNILWDNNYGDLVDTRVLIVNNDLDLNDKKIEKVVRKYINEYAKEMRRHLEINKGKSDKATDNWSTTFYFTMDIVANNFKKEMMNELQIDEETLANYVIKVSYKSLSISKSFAWYAFSDYIIKNLKNNSNPKRKISIIEEPYKTNNNYEYLGKYFTFEAKNEDQ